MKETIRVSLSGIAFNLDKEGYEKLDKYLTSIKNEYENQEQVEELLNDIETRIVELILNKQSATIPVDDTLISSIINQLGDVLEDEHRTAKKANSGEEANKDTNKTPPREVPSRRLNRRLYRNPKGAMLGGVCSGMGAYFDIDAIFFRLAFIVIPFISIFIHFIFPATIFFATLFYIALWFAIPRARAPREFLEMRGEPVTQKRMESYLKEEFKCVDENVSRITRSELSASVLSNLLVIIVKITKYTFMFIGCAILFGLMMSIILAVAIWIYGLANYEEFLGFICESNVYLNAAAILIIVILPLVIMALLLIKAIFKVKLKKYLLLSMLGVWICASMYATITAYFTYSNYRIEEKTTEEIEMQLEGDTLYVKSLQPRIYSNITLNPFEVDEDLIKSVSILHNVHHVKGEFNKDYNDKKVVISIEKRAYAKSRPEAYNASINLPLKYFFVNDTLFVNHYFELNKGKNIFNTCYVKIESGDNIIVEKDKIFFER